MVIDIGEAPAKTLEDIVITKCSRGLVHVTEFVDLSNVALGNEDT